MVLKIAIMVNQVDLAMDALMCIAQNKKIYTIAKPIASFKIKK